MPTKPWDRLWTGANLATMTDASLGVIRQGAIAATGGRIAWLGREAELPPSHEQMATDVVACGGAWLTPGLIDCHTHIVFAGDRSEDFRRRLHGESYGDIARTGGGIMSSVRATRAATNDELTTGAVARGRELCSWGVTTIEVKSGYGLDLDTELRMLDVAAGLSSHLPADISPTLLAAHALPPEYAGRREEYVDLVVDRILPAALEQGHATAIDVFCEDIAFTPPESRRILEAGIAQGLHGRLHADQLTDLGGGALAAAVGARSADHLEYLSRQGVDAMAEADVCAVLLPGAAYTLGADRRPPVVALRNSGVPIAIATDANPGSSPITHVGAVMNLACILFGLTPEESLLGWTSAAAKVLALDHDRGVLAPGMRADFALWNVRDVVELCYWVGASPLRSLVKDGEPVIPRVAAAGHFA
ncbi:MAG: imidazolonepropionase [Gemmatimonadetes bacterium]|nr:imidazolonepropionase [Gemmatimonadota bacterium]MYA42892.1 imidazolonepropionase [Gemmatimonadota bacterium]MYE93906.1 imidazolonepropionase [Gemmatimonadota bacterium]MYJ12614.1 imidazolonepropionase [Gemmatimonadota bacterium]